MSCNWDVHCLDCSKDAGMSASHAADLRLLIDHREVLEQLESLLKSDGLWSMGLTVNGEDVVVGFFGDHRGHVLALRNDAGELDTPCGKTFICPFCGPVVCQRLDHSIAFSPLHHHFVEGHRVHWEEDRQS